jgi:WD40 repeat protein
MYELLEEGEIELHQPSSLQDICIEKISAALLDSKSYDLEAEEKKLKETLEKVPEPLCQKLIENMEAHLDTRWIPKGEIDTRVFNCFTVIKNFALYKSNDHVCIYDMSLDPKIIIKFLHDTIKGLFKAPNASLLAVISDSHIDIFSLMLPIKHTATIPIAHCTAFAFSWEEHPKLFIADINNTLSILSNIESNDYTCQQYIFPESTKILYLEASPNNQYLVATSRLIQQNSYIINLKNNEPFFQTIRQPICKPCIAPDSSFFAATLYTEKNEPSKSIIYKKSGGAITIDGEITAVKNKYIFTHETINDANSIMKIFDTEGILQHTYILNKEIIIPKNNNLCFYSRSLLYMPEELTNNDTAKLTFKIVFERARKRKNIGMLKLLETRATCPPDKQLVTLTIEQLEEEKAKVVKELKTLKREKKPEQKSKMPQYWWQQEKDDDYHEDLP